MLGGRVVLGVLKLMFARALCLENGGATSFWKLSSKSRIPQVAQHMAQQGSHG
jgi:hypothetical protein